MTVRLGDIAPDFTAPTTQGEIHFHEWLGDSWGVLFSHPKDFTPVCTTELGYVAKIKPEFDKRNVKVIGLSVDPVESHVRWEGDIEETQGTAVNFPMIGDPDRTVADLYDMIHENASDTLTVRSVFVIGPDKKVKLTLTYPASTGRNFDEILRVIDSLQLTADYKVATPAELEGRRGRHHRPGRVRRRRPRALPRRLEPRQALPPRHQATQPLTPTALQDAEKCVVRCAERNSPRIFGSRGQSQVDSTQARTGGARRSRWAAGSSRIWVAEIGTVRRSASTTTWRASKRSASSTTYGSDENTACGPSSCGQWSRNSAIHFAHSSSSSKFVASRWCTSITTTSGCNSASHAARSSPGGRVTLR